MEEDYDELVHMGFLPEEAVKMVWYKNFNSTISQDIINELLEHKKRYELTDDTIKLLEAGSSQDLIRNLSTYPQLRHYRFEKYIIPRNVPISAFVQLQRRKK